MTRDELMSAVYGYVEQLCEPRHHAEPVLDDNGHGKKRLRRAWTTVQPGLMTQLRAAAHEGLRVGPSAPSGGKPASRPPGCFDALNAHVYIAAQAADWVAMMKEPVRDYAEGNLRALIGLAPRMSDADLVRLHTETRYWHGMAATSTGWIERPYSPPVHCPLCGRFGSLRINVEGRAAYCSNRDRADGVLVCGIAWPPGTAGQVFDYVRRSLGVAA